MEVFGRYQVIHPIAKGGMAEIVLARPMSGGRRHCALKRILPAFSCDEHFVSMFIDEARITIDLSHPNVVRLDDFGQVDGVYFMAIEYVDGSDLGALLRTQVRSALPSRDPEAPTQGSDANLSTVAIRNAGNRR